MFKLESYITPIILSYVNRYINNFKPEDSQVSADFFGFLVGGFNALIQSVQAHVYQSMFPTLKLH